MNETLQILAARKSVRAYEPEPLSSAQKEAILQATLRAPTAGNQMLYSLVEIEDQALKDRLAETCDHQPFIASAPWVLLFLADCQRWHDYYRHSGVEALCEERGVPYRTPEMGDLMLACSDALIAAQTAVIAAESLGIGSCYIGDIMENYEIHRDLLDLPPYAFPIALVCFGYPTEAQKQRRQPDRYDRDLVVFRDAYRRLTPMELDRMEAQTSAKAGPDAANSGQRVYLRKFISDFALEMNRSVRKALEAWTPRTATERALEE